MTLADTVSLYVAVLLPLLRRADVCRAVDSLLARDALAGWWLVSQ